MAALKLKHLDGQEFTASPEDLARFRQNLRGQLLEAGGANYEQARRIYNAMIDCRPGLIARCSDVADVIASVNFAREHCVLMSVRSGGHNGPGLSLCDGGLVIDLSLMKGIRVDPCARTVRVEGGCVWGDVDHATHPFGLATVSGIVSTTGVAGLTLGGGHGYLTRRYGLTIDNLIEADVVLADGRLVSANENSNTDLFWAIRGGGGNFGVVTSFLFRLHPVKTVFGGPMLWPVEQAGDVLKWYRDFLPTAPVELYGFFAFLNIPPGPPFPKEIHLRRACGIVWCYSGDLEKAEVTIHPVRELGQTLFEHLGAMPYPALQRAFDALYPPGLQWYWKADIVKELSDEAIALHVRFGSNLPTTLSTMHLYPIDGAVHRIRSRDTAFRFRDCLWSSVTIGIDPNPANNPAMISWAKEYWEALHPHSAGGAYVNFMMEEGQERVMATYGENYERLAEIKTKYDPENLFRRNQNIRPSHT